MSADAVRIKPGMEVLFDRWGGEQTLRGVVRTVEVFREVAQLVLGEDVGRIGHADRVALRVVGQHDAAEAPGIGLRQLAHRLRIEMEMTEIDHRDVELPGQEAQHLVLRDQTEIDQRAAELGAALLLLLQRLLQQPARGPGREAGPVVVLRGGARHRSRHDVTRREVLAAR